MSAATVRHCRALNFSDGGHTVARVLPHIRQMLRITLHTHPDGTTMLLEGRLAGAWVDELTGCWQGLHALHDVPTVRVDLDGVTFVDARGRSVLAAMQQAGAVLVASIVTMRALVDELERAGPEPRRATTSCNVKQ